MAGSVISTDDALRNLALERFKQVSARKTRRTAIKRCVAVLQARFLVPRDMRAVSIMCFHHSFGACYVRIMRCLLVLVLVTSGLACLPVSAQDTGSSAVDDSEFPGDAFDRGTPYRSAEGFLATAGVGDYETAAEYLDLRNLRGEANELTGAQLARRFNVIIQRGDWDHIDDLIDDPAGRSNDNLPDYRDSIGVVLEGDKETRLYMQKVPRGDGVSIWKISNATVSLIPRLYQNYGYPEAVEDLRHILPDVSFLGYELFKWVIMLAVGIFAYGIVFLIAISVRRMLADPDSTSRQQVYWFLLIPFGIWVVIMAINATATTLGRGVMAETWARVSPVAILVTVWFMYASLNLARDVYSTYLHNRGRPGALVLLHPAANAIKILIAVVAVLIYLHKIGVNITAVLAGLGVGGIAVALALQKPMEDVLSAITLHTQQPIRIGDFCRVGDCTGTVADHAAPHPCPHSCRDPQPPVGQRAHRQYLRPREYLVPPDPAIKMRHHSGTTPASFGRRPGPVEFSRTDRARQSPGAVQ